MRYGQRYQSTGIIITYLVPLEEALLLLLLPVVLADAEELDVLRRLLTRAMMDGFGCVTLCLSKQEQLYYRKLYLYRNQQQRRQQQILSLLIVVLVIF